MERQTLKTVPTAQSSPDVQKGQIDGYQAQISERREMTEPWEPPQKFVVPSRFL
jgi:hypothetical protein